MKFRQIKTVQNHFGPNAHHYLSPNFQIQTNEIENIWLNVVNNHLQTGNKLRLVIFGEATLSLAQYFYNNYPNNFLSGIKAYYINNGFIHNGNQIIQTNFLDFLVARGILLFDLFDYPFPSDFYKRYFEVFINENHVESKLNLISPLFDVNTKFVFRYKMLFQRRNKRMLHNLNAFDSHFHRFDLDGTGNPHSVYNAERPVQVINPLVIPFL
jgi:hypothetical protein